MAVSMTALVVAMGGTGYAATQSDGGYQSAAATAKANKKAVARRGLRGLRGPIGPAGPVGAPGSALATAHIAFNGTLDTGGSKGVVQANVSHPRVGTYCISGLSSQPHNAVATIDVSPAFGGSPIVTTGIAPAPPLGCPAGTQVIVATANGSTASRADRTFYVALN